MCDLRRTSIITIEKVTETKLAATYFDEFLKNERQMALVTASRREIASKKHQALKV
ncbi:hypothetical protein EMIT0P258_340007 [Pseudomonas sp. IT-P258]